MQLHWKRILIELMLEIIMQLAPTSLDLLGVIAEYVVGLTESTQISAQLVLETSGQQHSLPHYTLQMPSIL